MDMAKDESGNYKVDEVKKADASVKTMADFTSPDILYKELIDSVKKYHPSTDISMIEKAYHIADEAHKGQLRKSGEPYIIHPLCVAIILAAMAYFLVYILVDKTASERLSRMPGGAYLVRIAQKIRR